jgi:predicted RNase H-like nuclease
MAVSAVSAHPDATGWGRGRRAGMARRRELLAHAGIRLEGDLGLTGTKVGADDVLDAAVVACTAQRVAAGEAMCLPDPPEVVEAGRTAAIWS